MRNNNNLVINISLLNNLYSDSVNYSPFHLWSLPFIRMFVCLFSFDCVLCNCFLCVNSLFSELVFKLQTLKYFSIRDLIVKLYNDVSQVSFILGKLYESLILRTAEQVFLCLLSCSIFTLSERVGFKQRERTRSVLLSWEVVILTNVLETLFCRFRKRHKVLIHRLSIQRCHTFDEMNNLGRKISYLTLNEILSLDI